VFGFIEFPALAEVTESSNPQQVVLDRARTQMTLAPKTDDCMLKIINWRLAALHAHSDEPKN
jgi:hypothetical protein